ncbi:T9SS type A sorting domain-containing protein [Pontibacter sp. H259]|uniref:T9SS type A sorting domain-containing protein n=1 Tax=Pontibacter sp. H259 TaxID=3133421 RepID=UPI0030C4EA26
MKLLINEKYLRVVKSLKHVVLLISLLVCSATAFAQIPSSYCDGNPSDWDGVGKHDTDVANAAGNTDDQFAQGAKDEDRWLTRDATRWHWSLGTANAKGDIQNIGVAVDGCVLRFFGDRTAVNGDAGIGFWFYRDPAVSLNPNGTFNGTHVNGDILILVNFLGGGGTAVPTTYEWSGSGLVELTSAEGCGFTNIDPIPDSEIPWDYTPKFGSGYGKGAFFEGYVDFCGTGTSLCFAKYLVETRNSQELTAALQDFALEDFVTEIPAPTVAITEPSLCGDAFATVTVTSTVEAGSTYTLVSGGISKSIGPTTAGQSVIFTHASTDGAAFLAAGSDFSLTVTNSAGCISAARNCDNQSGAAIRATESSSEIRKSESTRLKEITAYPVPFTSKVNVEFKSERNGNYSINLYDSKGKLVKELKNGKAKAGQLQHLEIDGRNLSDGMYFIRVVDGAGSRTVKLLKKE